MKRRRRRRRRRETWRSARPGLVSPLATARCFSNLEGKKKTKPEGRKRNHPIPLKIPTSL
jgi:hypothetical protein